MMSKFLPSMPKSWSARLASPSTQRASSRSSKEAQTISIACRKERASVIRPMSDEMSIVVAASMPSLCVTASTRRRLPRLRTSSSQGSSIKPSTVIPLLLNCSRMNSLLCGKKG